MMVTLKENQPSPEMLQDEIWQFEGNLSTLLWINMCVNRLCVRLCYLNYNAATSVVLLVYNYCDSGYEAVENLQ